MTLTPGMRTSEFLVAVVNFAGQVILALNGTIGDGTAVKYTLAGAVAYILSRGFAKYEQRTHPVVPAPPPAA